MKKAFVFIMKTAALAVFCLIAAPQLVFAAKAYDLIVPEADSRYLSEEEIEEMPLQVLCYGKNEIYAQHGRMFVSRELSEYFAEQVWYYGAVSAEDFSENVFNEYERANIQALSQKEKSLKEGGYVLDAEGYSFQPIYDYFITRDQTSGNGTAPAISADFDFDSQQNIISTACFTFAVPEEWELQWTYLSDSEDSISFCCGPVKANTEMDGELCTIFRMTDYEEDGYFPHADYLGESRGYYYYLLYPTDVRFDEAHADIYRKMEAGVEGIASTFRLL